MFFNPLQIGVESERALRSAWGFRELKRLSPSILRIRSPTSGAVCRHFAKVGATRTGDRRSDLPSAQSGQHKEARHV